MPTFIVGLSRTCLVKVEAKSIQDALHVAECFVGFKDESLETERDEIGFRINEVEMLDNQAFEVLES